MLIVWCVPSLNAQQLEWKNYTSYQVVRTLKVIDDTLYMVSTGGLLEISPTFDIIPYDNTNGLGSNNVSDIIKDASGTKWVAGFGRLTKLSGNQLENITFIDNDDKLFMLNCIFDDGDYLWVGTDIGLVLFSKTDDGGQIEDSYQLFGDLNPNAAVNGIYLQGDSIWLATSDGLAVANKSNPILLKSPSNWTTYNLATYPILATNDFKDIVFYESGYYAANAKGVFKTVLDSFGDAVFTKVSSSSDVTINNMQISEDSLLVAYNYLSSGYIDYITNDIASTVTNLGLSKPLASVNFQNELYISTEDDGLFVFENGVGLSPVNLFGLPDNDVSDIAVDKFGRLYAGFSDKAFAMQENDNIWDKFNFYVGQDATVAMVDSLDRIWMSTWGNGTWLTDGDTLINYDENNSSLRGNAEGPWWVYITGMDNDGRYAFFSSYRALNGYPIAIADLQNLNSPAGWDSIGVINGVANAFITSLDYDRNRVAVGTEYDGVYECFLKSNPMDDPDSCRHLVKENSFLIANSIRDLKYSPDGDLWVATNFGLSWLDPGIDFFRDIQLPAEMSSDITALEFDSRGNLWMGTPDGLARRNYNTGDIEIFTTFNSGLVDDHVKKITFDPYTGEVYIVTAGGISRISSLVGKPVFNVEEALAFPNPYIINDADDKLSFNFGEAGSVSIFTSAGELVKSTTVNLGWDGTNENGAACASGVYLYRIEDKKGTVGKGKILLVRN